jgi:hypothetical protein
VLANHPPVKPKGCCVVVGIRKPGTSSATVVTRYGYAVSARPIEVIETSNPVTQGSSRMAGVRIPGVHEDYICWERAEAIRKMVSDNARTSRHHGAPKHGDAMLAGLLRCRRCGPKLVLRYTGVKHDIPRYSCWRGLRDTGEPRCIAFGGLRVDAAIGETILQVVEPHAITTSCRGRRITYRTRGIISQRILR